VQIEITRVDKKAEAGNQGKMKLNIKARKSNLVKSIPNFLKVRQNQGAIVAR